MDIVLQTNNKNITKIIKYIMILRRKNANKIIMFDRLWKNIKINKKYKRYVREVGLNDINLKEYIIIDVRSKREFEEGHLNGAMNMPLAEIKKRIEYYVKNKQNKLLICCQYGVRSKKAVQLLNDMGYTNVYNLKGGLENI